MYTQLTDISTYKKSGSFEMMRWAEMWDDVGGKLKRVKFGFEAHKNLLTGLRIGMF
jgi:hypothetical protein